MIFIAKKIKKTYRNVPNTTMTKEKEKKKTENKFH